MAVDYTKIFTVIGSYVDKVNDYYAYISIFTSDQSSIEAILSAQSLVRLEADLVSEYDGFKNDVSGWVGLLINRVAAVLTDQALIGANFNFGSAPSLDIVWPALIADMNDNDKNVVANTATIGSRSYTTANVAGKMLLTTQLDGVTPPMAGAPAQVEYVGKTSQLTPTSESVAVVCISDSDHGATRGSEVFEIRGTGPEDSGFGVTGENIGIAGTITCTEATTPQYVSNYSLDEWDGTGPVGWSVDSGVLDTDFERGATTVPSGAGSSIRYLQTDTPVNISITVAKELVVRNKTYFFGIWVAKDTDIAGDQPISLRFSNTLSAASATVTPTSTSWDLLYATFVVPAQLGSDITLEIKSTNAAANDPIFIDQVVFAPVEYFSGVGMGISSGPEKFLEGDQVTFTISNDNNGKFQTFFRKAFKIQLPTDATPTISDSLVT